MKKQPARQTEQIALTYYTPFEVAEIVNVDPQTVRLWCKRQYLPASKFGKFYRIDKTEFENWIKNRKI
jgi:excisionase family DNA binding protein